MIGWGRLAWFENPGGGTGEWTRHDISRRKRGMFDMAMARDLDGDGDIDFVGTRGNSVPYDGGVLVGAGPHGCSGAVLRCRARHR